MIYVKNPTFPEKIMFHPPKFLMTFLFSHQLWFSICFKCPPIFGKTTKPTTLSPVNY